MKTISVTKARNKFAQILSQAKNEPIIITKHNKNTNVIMPYFMCEQMMDIVINIVKKEEIREKKEEEKKKMWGKLKKIWSK